MSTRTMIYVDGQVITGAAVSNLIPDGAIEVPEEVYREAAGKVNRARWVNGAVVDAPDLAPSPPPATYSKVMLFKAMTDAEFETFQAVKAMQSARKQAVFDNATVLDSADEDFVDFEALMHGTFGNDRAEELLNAARL